MTRSNLELLLVSFIWGINGIAVKDALSGFTPLQFNVIRLSLAASLLLLVLKASGNMEVPSRADWPKVILAGFLGNTLYQYLFIKGIALSSASNTSFVLATMPATTAVLSHFTGKQRMNGRMWSGVLLTMCGVALIVAGGAGGLSGLGGGSLAGDLTTLSGTIGWCLCTIFAADLTKRMSPLAFTAWTMVAGAVLMVPLSVGELLRADWSAPSALHWTELVLSGTLANAFSYILWNRGVKSSGPASTAVFSNLNPVWTGVFAYFILGETWNARKVAGAAVILAGVTLVRMAAHLRKPAKAVAQS
ncbi:MAG: DMT family transporter [Bacillota bacterium]